MKTPPKDTLGETPTARSSDCKEVAISQSINHASSGGDAEWLLWERGEERKGPFTTCELTTASVYELHLRVRHLKDKVWVEWPERHVRYPALEGVLLRGGRQRRPQRPLVPSTGKTAMDSTRHKPNQPWSNLLTWCVATAAIAVLVGCIIIVAVQPVLILAPIIILYPFLTAQRGASWKGRMICQSCGYEWKSRRNTPPRKCANCNGTGITAIIQD